MSHTKLNSIYRSGSSRAYMEPAHKNPDIRIWREKRSRKSGFAKVERIMQTLPLTTPNYTHACRSRSSTVVVNVSLQVQLSAYKLSKEIRDLLVRIPTQMTKANFRTLGLFSTINTRKSLQTYFLPLTTF